MRETIMIETIGYGWHERETELTNILRWEDDGGLITELNTAAISLFFNRPQAEYGAIQNGSIQN